MDKLHPIPVDRVAARVVGKGFQYEPATRGSASDSETPIPVAKKLPRALTQNPGFVNLTGNRIGRLTVVGVSEARYSTWVCRCDCGRYCLRSAAAIKNESNSQDRCSHCRHLAFLKRDEYRRTYGKDVDIRKF